MRTIELADGVYIHYRMENVFGEMKVHTALIHTACETAEQHEEASELIRESYDDNESLKIAALEDYRTHYENKV